MPWADLLPAGLVRCGGGALGAPPEQLVALEWEEVGPDRVEVGCDGEPVFELWWEHGAWRLHLGSFDELASAPVDAISVYALHLGAVSPPVDPGPAAAPDAVVEPAVAEPAPSQEAEALSGGLPPEVVEPGAAEPGSAEAASGAAPPTDAAPGL